MIATHYDITKSELDEAPFKEGNIYFCYDTGDLFLDSTSGDRVPIGNSFYPCNTLPLAPIPNVLYFCYDGSLASLNVWTGTNWMICHLNNQTIVLKNFTIPADTKSVTYTDTRLTSRHKGAFYTDSSISDLVPDSKITVNSANGSLTVSADKAYPYPIFGDIILYGFTGSVE